MGKEEFFCPIMGYRFNPLPEGIKALVDLSYGIGGKVRGDVGIRFDHKKVLSLIFFQPLGLVRGTAKTQKQAFLGKERRLLFLTNRDDMIAKPHKKYRCTAFHLSGANHSTPPCYGLDQGICPEDITPRNSIDLSS